MQHIETVTVGSGGAASITFSAIPADFTDLVLVCSTRSTRTGFPDDIVGLRVNGSSANFSTRYLYGSGSGVVSGTSNYSFPTCAAGSTANTFGNASVYISNYGSSSNKSISSDGVSENNGTESYQQITAQLWSQTAAITSLQLFSVTSNNFAQHSSASLYGITAGSSGGVVVS